MSSRRQVLQRLCAGTAAPWLTAWGADTVKVGILHSLSGTMAISETVLKDVMRMLIVEQNQKGGLLGRRIEPAVVDPASDWPLFAQQALELIAPGFTDGPRCQPASAPTARSRCRSAARAPAGRLPMLRCS